MTNNEIQLLRLLSLFQQILIKAGVHRTKAGRDADLTTLQEGILDTIARNKNITMSELSREGLIVLSAATRIVDDLENRGLVKRMNDGSDRRITRLRMTAKGRKVNNAVRKQSVSVLRTVMVKMNHEEQDSLVTGLQGLLNAVRMAEMEQLENCQKKECIQLNKLAKKQS